MHARVVGCAPVPKARPGSTTTDGLAGRRRRSTAARSRARRRAPGGGTPSSDPPSRARPARSDTSENASRTVGLAGVVRVDGELHACVELALLEARRGSGRRSQARAISASARRHDARRRAELAQRSALFRRLKNPSSSSARRVRLVAERSGRRPRAAGAARRRARSAPRRRAGRRASRGASRAATACPRPRSTRTSPGWVPGRHLELELARERRDRRRRPERGVRHRQPHRRVQVVSVAHEARIGPDAHDDERVASLGAPEAGVPLAADADLLAVVDPLRDVDLELPPRDDAPVAAALGARLLEHLADAAAVRARPLLDELAEDVLRDAPHDAGARARRARARRRARLGAASRRSARTEARRRAERSRTRPANASSRSISTTAWTSPPRCARCRPPAAAEQVLAEERREDVRRGSRSPRTPARSRRA